MTVSLKRRLALLLGSLLSGLILAYQWGLSPVLGPRCRYWPSCSHYCLESLRIHGTCQGLRLSVLRVLRCHPWGGSGYDPVPKCTTCGSNEVSRHKPKRQWPAQLRGSTDAEH